MQGARSNNRQLHLQQGGECNLASNYIKEVKSKRGKGWCTAMLEGCKTEREKKRPATGKVGFSVKRAKMKLSYDRPAY